MRLSLSSFQTHLPNYAQGERVLSRLSVPFYFLTKRVIHKRSSAHRPESIKSIRARTCPRLGEQSGF